ncbi:hypothetical protein [Paraburkholderia diazotrophica]|uniref:hypothetical protein n=1 Tax=Paraburkholderia diazotrophica TaxID=667676 RepID=UPI003178BF5A
MNTDTVSAPVCDVGTTIVSSIADAATNLDTRVAHRVMIGSAKRAAEISSARSQKAKSPVCCFQQTGLFIDAANRTA